MKYKLLRFSLLSMLVMLFGGVSSVWADDTSGTIKFGNDDVKINSASVTGNDNLGNTWTITTVGTSSFSSNKTYYQVGKKDEPATSITFTTTLAKEVNVTSLSAKFGGFNNTAGDVSLKVDNTEVGSGSLNASNDVTVKSTKSETGKVLTVSITNIDKGVKCYYISYTYNDQTDQRVKTSIVFADGYATEGMEFTTIDLPTATVKDANDNMIEGAAITWTSSNEEVATISGTQINLLTQGTTVIKATYAGDETAYRGSEKSYTLTVTETDQIANPYVYVFEKKTFDENDLTKKLKNVTWTVTTDAGYFGYDTNDTQKGQQFGSGTAPAKSLKLTLSDIPGTITSVKVNTSGAKDIAATFGIKVGETSFQNGEATEATLTSEARDYTFTGSASGDVVISYTQTSSVAIYIKSIEITYKTETEEEGWRDIKADLTSESLLPEGAKQWDDVSTGIAVAADGTLSRVAKDAENAEAIFNGKWHGAQYGWANFSATVKVEGCVKITLGQNNYGKEAIVKDAKGNVVAKIDNMVAGKVWSPNNPADLISVGYYRVNEPTTLTLEYGSYLGYFAVEAIDPADLPEEITEYTITFDKGEVEGIAPTTIKVESGKTATIPANRTLWVEGKTLTAWTDGTTQYAPGSEITPTADMTLTPVFTKNEVSLADRTEPVTLKWNFRRDQGAPSVQWQGQDNLVWVAQAEVNGKTIDVATHFSTAPGKFNNTGWNDWCQLNDGTTFKIPSCKGATISVEGFNVLGVPATSGSQNVLTIDGQSDYTTGKTISYEIAGTAETVDVVFGNEGSYYRYIQVVLPVVESQGGGETFDNVAGTITWPVGNETSGLISDNIKDAISATSVSVGNNLSASAAKYFETDMVKYRPATGNVGAVEGVLVEYRVKPKAGITFKPTNVSYAAVKVGTDGATYSWSYTLDGKESAITKIDAKPDLLRNDNSNGVDNGGTAQLMHSHDITADAAEEFTFRFYISDCANNKDICIGNIVISGVVNGTVQDVAQYTLTAAAAPEEGGSVNVYPAGGTYDEGTTLKLTATENFGYDFVNWTNEAGEEVSTDAVYTFDITKNETLTANFKAVETYELALTVDGTNDYMVTVSPAPDVVDGKRMYEAGTTVELTANQYEGLVTFANWSDSETASNKIVKMDSNVTLTAIYTEADIIAGWDFYTKGGEGRKADFAAQDNEADALSLVNTETGETSGWLDKSTEAAGGYESFKGAAVNWRDNVGTHHWQTKVNAEAFENINVQFQMLYNYNSYQKYNAEYSFDGETWVNFGSITMEGAKNAASFSEKLPEACNNKAELYIRMIADKNSEIVGAAGKDGNALAMFFITGTPKIVNDHTAPVLVSTVPADGATGVSASGKIVLTFDERVKVKADTKATLGTAELTPVVSGKVVTFEYKGLDYATEYNFVLAGKTVGDLTDNMIQDDITVSFTTMERPTVEKKLYDAVVENVDQLMAAISEAQNRADKNVRYRIFLKKGTYTLPRGASKHYRHTNGKSGSDEVVFHESDYPDPITYFNAQNVSIIGEDRDATIITNDIPADMTFEGAYGAASVYEGIGNSDVFQLSGNNSYWQDLTVSTGMEDNRGRDIAVEDKGTRTIWKNTKLHGYQDTWVGQNDNGLYYFEDGVIRGRTDYICGKGDAYYNQVEFQQIAGGYCAVPSKPANIGWVMKDCTINGDGSGVDGNYTLGRPWGQGTPVALWIDTKMNVVPSAIGWNEMSGGWPARFAEYNSMTSTGSQVDLSGRKKTFGDGHANNPVLTAAEALNYSDKSKMFGEWDPTLATEQAPIVTDVKLTDNELSWTGSNYALLYAIVKNGEVIDFTTETTYNISTAGSRRAGSTDQYQIRAANEMGGLNEASEVATETDGIETVNDNVNVNLNDNIYNLQGIRVNKAQKGVYIIGGRKVVIK